MHLENSRNAAFWLVRGPALPEFAPMIASCWALHACIAASTDGARELKTGPALSGNWAW
jgi:hypothetical protein